MTDWRQHPAHPVLAAEMKEVGAPFPKATADFIFRALDAAGFAVGVRCDTTEEAK